LFSGMGASLTGHLTTVNRANGRSAVWA
jgi:hypothetical protein